MPSYRFAIAAPLSNTHIGFRVSLSVDAVRQTLKLTGPAMPNGAKFATSKFPPLASEWVERVTDLSALKNSPANTKLCIHWTGVRDLSPLRETPIREVSMFDNQLDPDVVCHWPLKAINFEKTKEGFASGALLRLKEIKTLETIDGKPVAEFWKEFDQ